MKKRRKQISATPKSVTSSLKMNVSHEPPQSLINEMTRLFQAGEEELLAQKAKKVVQRWPSHPFGWKALGSLMLNQGRFEDVLKYVSKSLELDPHDAQSLNYLGIAFLELGRLEEAMASCRKAITLDPDYAHAYNNLGNALKKLESLEEAVASYRKALALKKDLVEAHYNLGNALIKLGYVDEAGKSFKQALLLRPNYVEAQSGLGHVFLKRNQLNDAISSFRKCLDLDPKFLDAQDGLYRTLSSVTPYWHVPMMNDSPRNSAYFEALQNAMTPETNVLEIGTGSGLLSMMSAKLGARKVTTCEAVPRIAETARGIVSDNGFAPVVSVISKKSTEMIVGEDLDERADLCVSEILSSDFLSEGILPSLEDAKKRLLKPDARMIPARGSIQFALFGGIEIENNVRVDEVYGFDLSRFNTIIPQKQFVSRNDLNIELLSDDASAFYFDFVKTSVFPETEEKLIEVPVRKAGRCCGVIQWIKLEMDDEVTFENHPSIKNPSSSWQYGVFPFPKTIDISPGQCVVISAAHNRHTPWFFFEGLK